MRSSWPLWLLVACADPVSTVTVALPLVPDDVQAITVWVTDQDTVVASATISAPIDTVELGVPAEVPLVFNVLARVDEVGPEALGGRMPGWAGRVRRRIALGAEQAVVQLVARPAGALTLQVEAERRTELRLVSEQGEPPIPWRVGAGVNMRVFALRSGRYRLETDDPDVGLVPADGFFVAPRVESVGRSLVFERPSDPPPEAARGLRMTLDGLDTATVSVSVRAETLAGELISMPIDAEVTLAVGNEVRTAPELPAVFEVVVAHGRAVFEAEAVVDGRTLSVTERTNVGSVEAGPPARLRLSVKDEAALGEGTRLVAELLDESDLYAQGGGTLDLSTSDPWVFFPDGPEATLLGALERPIARPSGPRGLFVVLRGTYTSTVVVPGTFTASVALPVLELSP